MLQKVLNKFLFCSISQSVLIKKKKSKKRFAQSSQEGPTTSKQSKLSGTSVKLSKKEKLRNKKEKTRKKKNKRSKLQAVAVNPETIDTKQTEEKDSDTNKYTISKNLRSNLEAEVVPGIPYYPERSRSVSGTRSRDRKSSFNSLEDIKLKVVGKSVDTSQGTQDIQVDIAHTSVQNPQSTHPSKKRDKKKRKNKERRSSSTSSKSLSPELDSLRRTRRSKTGSCASSR